MKLAALALLLLTTACESKEEHQAKQDAFSAKWNGELGRTLGAEITHEKIVNHYGAKKVRKSTYHGGCVTVVDNPVAKIIVQWNDCETRKSASGVIYESRDDDSINAQEIFL